MGNRTCPDCGYLFEALDEGPCPRCPKAEAADPADQLPTATSPGPPPPAEATEANPNVRQCSCGGMVSSYWPAICPHCGRLFAETWVGVIWRGLVVGLLAWGLLGAVVWFVWFVVMIVVGAMQQ